MSALVGYPPIGRVHSTPKSIFCDKMSMSTRTVPPEEPDLKRPSNRLSESSRSLSANSLRDRLSKLAATPLHVPNPVAALQSNVRCVDTTLRLSTLCFTLYSSFVPARIPRKRRIQTLVVLMWSTMIMILSALWLILWYVLACSPLLSTRLYALQFGPMHTLHVSISIFNAYLTEGCRTNWPLDSNKLMRLTPL